MASLYCTWLAEPLPFEEREIEAVQVPSMPSGDRGRAVGGVLVMLAAVVVALYRRRA